MCTLDLPQGLKTREIREGDGEMEWRRKLEIISFIQTYLQKGSHNPDASS
jgi:hypothetical protein